MNIQHSNRSNEWFTPVDILERVRAVLGTIDLDPASCAEANRLVCAKEYYTNLDDGLKQDWRGNVYVNPPGGKTGNRSNVGIFWAKLMHEQQYIDQAIFMCFSSEALQTTQRYAPLSVLDFPICIPKRRVRFIPEGNVLKHSPSHSNAIVYVPGRVDNRKLFYESFATLGAVR